MRLALILGGVVVAVAVLFAAYLRLVPSDPALWHVDPRAVSRTSAQGSYLLRDGPATGAADDDAPAIGVADGPAPRFAGSPDAVLGRFHAVAVAQPRVTVLAGSPAAGHITYVARSRLFGFPDYISVVAYPAQGGTALAIYARLRFGRSDMGVNRRRVRDWLAAMG